MRSCERARARTTNAARRDRHCAPAEWPNSAYGSVGRRSAQRTRSTSDSTSEPVHVCQRGPTVAQLRCALRCNVLLSGYRWGVAQLHVLRRKRTVLHCALGGAERSGELRTC